MALSFDIPRLQSLRQGRLGADLRVKASTASTQDDLRQALAEGADEGCVCLAGEQTQGRGRFGRKWQGNPGKSLLFSLALRAEPAGGPLTQAPLLLGLAGVKALRALGLVQAEVKWPNDLLWHHRKLGGWLVEHDGPWLIAGLGLNLAQTDEDWPPELKGRATSLAQAGLTRGPEEVLAAVLAAIEVEWERWRSEGFEAARGEWEAVAGPRDAGITVLPAPGGKGAERMGRWTGLAEDGGLRVLLANGVAEVLHSGEVSLAVAPPGGGA